MDFHAHLDKHEVIGLLAGRWDAASRTLTVERAFPVREAGAAGSNDGINVEMDTEDQFKASLRTGLHGLHITWDMPIVLVYSPCIGRCNTMQCDIRCICTQD